MGDSASDSSAEDAEQKRHKEQQGSAVRSFAEGVAAGIKWSVAPQRRLPKKVKEMPKSNPPRPVQLESSSSSDEGKAAASKAETPRNTTMVGIAGDVAGGVLAMLAKPKRIPRKRKLIKSPRLGPLSTTQTQK